MKTLEHLTLKQLVDLLEAVEQKHNDIRQISDNSQHLTTLDVSVIFGCDEPHVIPAMDVFSMATFIETALDNYASTIKLEIKSRL
jgi:hypothetical protein